MKPAALMLAAVLLSVPLPVHGAEPETGYIFLGDSRTVGMGAAAEISDMEDIFVVAECGMGYEWMMETALPKIEDIMEDHPEYDGWVLMTNLGINDVIGGAGKYLETYEGLSDDITVYTVSLNPCKGDYSYLNKYVEAFNEELAKSGFSYIDTWSVLDEEGFDSRDGLHYDKETYELIFDIIMDEVE